MRNDFACFILTHGRADNVKTEKTLRACGYTGKVLYVIDDEDEQGNQYRERFGADRVFEFCKAEEMRKCDQGNNWDIRATITYARNACWDIAKRAGVKYFMQLDDDYLEVSHRLTHELEYGWKMVKQLDKVLTSLIEYYESIRVLAIAIAQNGDFIGGEGSGMHRKVKRKAMNSFICSVDRPFRFVGTLNEDVNTYVTLGSRGEIFFTVGAVSLRQTQTQASEGGITETYKRFGTYTKALSTVIMAPSCVQVGSMGNVNRRIHHEVKWRYAVPKIVNPKYKKLRYEKA